MRKLAILVIAAMLVSMCAVARAEEPADNSDLMAYLGQCFSWDDVKIYERVGSGQTPAYAAPSEDAYRAANGFAAASLREPFTLLAYENDKWMLVEYDTSKSEKRVAYIRKPADFSGNAPYLPQTTVGLILKEEAVLTDDPLASGRDIMKLPVLSVDVLGYVDDTWAYVETELNGKEVRGFIPLSALEMPAQLSSMYAANILYGTWRYAGGENAFGDALTFTGDGQIVTYSVDPFTLFPANTLKANDEPLTCSIYYNDADERYDSDYILVIREAEGSRICGLSAYAKADGSCGLICIEENGAKSFYQWEETEEAEE